MARKQKTKKAAKKRDKNNLVFLVGFRKTPVSVGAGLASAIEVCFIGWETDGAPAQALAQAAIDDGWEGVWSYTKEPKREALAQHIQAGRMLGEFPYSHQLYVNARNLDKTAQKAAGLPTSLADLPRSFREVLGAHEMLRRLGFSAHDLYIHFEPESRCVYCALVTQGQPPFGIGLDPDPEVPDLDSLAAQWPHAVTLWNEGDEAESEALWVEWNHMLNEMGGVVDLIMKIQARGIVLPAAAAAAAATGMKDAEA